MQDDCILVPLSQGKFAKIDAADAEMVLAHTWSYVQVRPDVGYATTTIGGKTVYMHRLINGTPDGLKTDHINHDTLDNCRANLQTVDDTLSVHRRRPYGKSGYRGVRVNLSGGGAFEARIRKDRVEYFLGAYVTAEEAALAYNAKAIELYGECALLNVVAASAVEPVRLKKWRNNQGGEGHGMSRLTNSDVAAIRERAATGPRGTLVILAKEYDVSYTHIKRIVGGKAWS